jgi:hypothetical protein
MQADDVVAHQTLRAILRSRVRESFTRAHRCLTYARIARECGDRDKVQEWLESVLVFRTAAARWRKRAEKLAPVLMCLLWCLVGCAKAPLPPREFTANFEVQPSGDGSAIVWSLQFKTREQYHAFLETTAEGADRAKIRELIAAGMKLHHIVGCSAQETAVKKLGNDGIAFIGSCPGAAHAVLAGGI